MKRELLDNVKVAPYTSGAAIDRQNFLSAILAATVTVAGVLTLTITHSDDNAAFEPITDTRISPETGTITGGVINLNVEAGEIVNVDLDLLGCKQYVKVTVSGAAAAGATFAYALGDPADAPV